MYNGKYNRKRRLRWKREFVLTCSVVILVLGMVGGSLAYLFTNTAPVENTFTPPTIEVEVTEGFDEVVKTNAGVKNTSSFNAYVRATYAIFWQNEAGDVYGEAPELGTDYSLTMGNNWVKVSDGYCYYTAGSVAPNAVAADLIVKCERLNTPAPEGYHMVVDVIGELIQAEPADAVTEIWGVKAAELVGAK